MGVYNKEPALNRTGEIYFFLNDHSVRNSTRVSSKWPDTQPQRAFIIIFAKIIINFSFKRFIVLKTSLWSEIY